MRRLLEFYECEHPTDLDHYIEDIVDCGGTIISSEVDYDGEIGTVLFDHSDIKTFDKKFEETEAYNYVN